MALAIVLLNGATTAIAAGDSVADLLTRMGNAYGRMPPTAIRVTGTTTSFRRGPGVLVRLYRPPDGFRILIDYADGREMRSMLREQFWQQDKPANPALAGAIGLQAARVGLPWLLMARPELVVDQGHLSRGEKTLRILMLDLTPTQRLIAEIDPDTALILHSRSIQAENGSSIEFATTYGDFRMAHGRIYAASEQHYAMGRHTGHSSIGAIDYPESIPDSAFKP